MTPPSTYDITCLLRLGERREDPQRTCRHPGEAPQAIDHFAILFASNEPTWRRKKKEKLVGKRSLACKQRASNLQIEQLPWLKVWYWNQRLQLKRLALSRDPAAFALPRSQRRDPLPASVQRARMAWKGNSRRLVLASLACRTRDECCVRHMRGTRD